MIFALTKRGYGLRNGDCIRVENEVMILEKESKEHDRSPFFDVKRVKYLRK